MIKEPNNFENWINLFKSKKAKFETYKNLPSPSDEFRVIIRHDIDLFDILLLDKCRSFELQNGVKSTWLFLPHGDKRYNNQDSKFIAKYMRDLKSDGFEVGMHINAWEIPGTYQLTNDPLAILDDELKWMSDVLGEKIKVALAHGIPRHKEIVSNFSMYDALKKRGIPMQDIFIIHDGGIGKKIPHFGFRSENPLLKGLDITYTSDSGGPIRKEWVELESCLRPKMVFILGMHCGNYSIDRELSYRTVEDYSKRI